MNRAANRAFRPIQKHIDARNIAMDEADGSQRGKNAVEILPSDQYINVLRIPHRLLIDPRNPRGDGIAADDHIGNPRLLQGRSCATGPLSDGFHGGVHPFPGEILERNDGHTKSFQSLLANPLFDCSVSLRIWQGCGED